MKTINLYVVHDAPVGAAGDEFTVCPTFDKTDALNKARNEWDHLTTGEQSRRHVYVGVHRVTVSDDDRRTAAQMMSDMIDDDSWPFDHDEIGIGGACHA